MAASEYMWVKLIKKWGGYQSGETIRLGRSKGESRIKAGIAEEAKKPKPIETATLIPKAETAILNRNAKAEAKARAKAEAKASAEKKAESEKKSEENMKSDNKKGEGHGWRK